MPFFKTMGSEPASGVYGSIKKLVLLLLLAHLKSRARDSVSLLPTAAGLLTMSSEDPWPQGFSTR